jgi:hypothetical protein
MTAKDSNKSATPQKKLSVRSALGSALGVAVLGTSFFLSVGVNKSHAEIIDSVTENISQASGRHFSSAKGGSACNHLQNVTTFMGNTAHPVRAGQQAFMHQVDRCGERSEFEMKRTEIGKTYWYGWSMFIPSNWQDSDAGGEVVSQWLSFPGPHDFRKACGASASFIARGRSGTSRDRFYYFLQHAGDTVEIECNKFPLTKVSEMRGKWVDFAMNVKWTGNKDGFVKLWMKIGNGSYTQKVDYKGRTFFNDEGAGPYFKMGLYKGDPNFAGPAPRIIYTDEYRLGNDRSSFEEVSPH